MLLVNGGQGEPCQESEICTASFRSPSEVGQIDVCGQGGRTRWKKGIKAGLSLACLRSIRVAGAAEVDTRRRTAGEKVREDEGRARYI